LENGFSADKGTVSVTTENVPDGVHALKIDMRSGKGTQWRSRINAEKEAVFSYMVNLEGSEDVKLPGLCSGDCPGLEGDAGGGFSAAYRVMPGNKLVVELYHANRLGAAGQMYPVTVPVTLGNWVRLTQRVKINDAGQSNNEVQVRVGEQEGLYLNNVDPGGGNVDWVLFTAKPAKAGGGFVVTGNWTADLAGLEGPPTGAGPRPCASSRTRR